MQADVRFYAELRDFLSAGRRSGDVSHRFDVPGSVKDLIEAHGVPHTEVDLVLVNGVSVDFSHRVADGDRVSVFPVFEALDVSSVTRVRPHPLRRVRFVLDGHLARLARYLRLLGFDTRCPGDASDHQLVAISRDEHRILLTRDTGLLKHGAVTHGSFVRATAPRAQLIEIVRRFHLAGKLAPFTRCMRCNGELADVPGHEATDRVPARTRQAFDEFRRCAECGRVYWKGSHHRRLREIVAEAQRG